MVEKQVLQQVRAWGNELLNLSRSNNLLYFKHLKVATLEILSPNPSIILDYLYEAKGKPIHFEIDNKADEPASMDKRDQEGSIESTSLDTNSSLVGTYSSLQEDSGKSNESSNGTFLTSKTKLVDLEAL